MTGIASFGSVNVDLVVRAQRLPVAGETLAGQEFRAVLGGKGANQAVGAARLGAPGLPPARMIGLVGEDAFGVFARERLVALGVDVRDMSTAQGVSTGVALIHIDAAGENAITIVAGANGRVDAAVFDAAAARAGLPTILLLQGEIPLEASLHAARRVRAAGGLVLFDPAPPQPTDRLAALLAETDVALPNAHEAAALTGIIVADDASARAAAAALLALGARAAIVKRGAAGAWLLGRLGGRRHDERVHAIPVATVDTVAAGDCFAGALAAALQDRLDLATAALFATRAAAISVTRAGAADSMPARSELEIQR